MKIAQFNPGPGSLRSTFTILDEETGKVCVKFSGWVRLTEYVEVTFAPLPKDVIVEGQLKQIDESEAELRTKFQEKLNELANERAKLLSLTHESAS